MRAGFAKVCCNPPPGVRMIGYMARETDRVTAIRDDIHVRALYLAHGPEEALLLVFDMCFVGREESDRFKGAVGRALDLRPRQILIHATHSHMGPALGRWAYGDFLPPERDYLRLLEEAATDAARKARAAAVEATVWAGMGRSTLPMSRRRRMETGRIENRPNPGGVVCDALPVCVLRDRSERVVAALCSVSAHASNCTGTEISDEYPGVAMRRIEAQLGGGCLFLQGCAGDARCSVSDVGRDRWLVNDISLLEKAGALAADEALAVIAGGLHPVSPDLCTAMEEAYWPLESAPDRAALEALRSAADPLLSEEKNTLRRAWAERQLWLRDHGYAPASAASILVQGLRIGDGLRLVALEGEPVSELGRLILDAFPGGVTFPLGYSNGEALYLPAAHQAAEGGYEVTSFWEYGYPARLQPCGEEVVGRALEALRAKGIV